MNTMIAKDNSYSRPAAKPLACQWHGIHFGKLTPGTLFARQTNGSGAKTAIMGYKYIH